MSLERATDEAVDNLAQLIDATHAQITIERPLAEAIGHHPIVVQLIANLISNAVKFVTPGATPRVRIHSQVHRHWVTLWVEDNGIGIPEAEHERIFQVFERLTTVEHYPGTGLGLAIVVRGVARLGGLVGLDSTPGQGSRFWIALRRVEELAADADAEAMRIAKTET